MDTRVDDGKSATESSESRRIRPHHWLDVTRRRNHPVNPNDVAVNHPQSPVVPRLCRRARRRNHLRQSTVVPRLSGSTTALPPFNSGVFRPLSSLHIPVYPCLLCDLVPASNVQIALTTFSAALITKTRAGSLPLSYSFSWTSRLTYQNSIDLCFLTIYRGFVKLVLGAWG